MQLNCVNSVRSCQPLKQTASAVPLRDNVSFKSSNAQPTSSDKLEQKYDFACRLAAFYKKQYEQLAKQGSCCV